MKNLRVVAIHSSGSLTPEQAEMPRCVMEYLADLSETLSGYISRKMVNCPPATQDELAMDFANGSEIYFCELMQAICEVQSMLLVHAEAGHQFAKRIVQDLPILHRQMPLQMLRQGLEKTATLASELFPAQPKRPLIGKFLEKLPPPVFYGFFLLYFTLEYYLGRRRGKWP